MRESRDIAAARVMEGALEETLSENPVDGGSLLSALDETGRVADRAAQLGLVAESWHRFAVPFAEATPWPAPGQFEIGTLRLPKGREALDMSLSALLARLRPGARLFVYGANDEGARSLGPRLEEHLQGVRTLATRKHCRVWAGRRTDDTKATRADLDDWLERVAIETPSGPLSLLSAPGLFAHGRLDAGTRLLLEALGTLPRLKPGGRVLDYGCGAGTITLALARESRETVFHGVDRDGLAIHCAQQNLPEAAWHLGDGWTGVPSAEVFDWIVSNPPLHEGKDQELRHLDALADGARKRLTRRGRLVLVTQRPLPVGALLRRRFQDVALAREDRSYRVWTAQRPTREAKDR